MDGLGKAFSVDDFTEIITFVQELRRLFEDAKGAIQGHDIAHVSLYDFAGASFSSLMQKMECEFLSMCAIRIYMFPSSIFAWVLIVCF